jgi:hypothetical protein
VPLEKRPVASDNMGWRVRPRDDLPAMPAFFLTEGGSFGDGTPVIQWPINNSDTQKWRFVEIDNRRYEIVNVKTNKCLTLSSESLGAGLIQWPRAARD